MAQVITTAQEFINMVKNASANGHYVTVYGESDVQLRKFNTDGLPKEHIKDDFHPRSEFSVTFHFGQDYEKTMSKILGEDYKASDKNRRHIVKNVVMQYISTGTVCLIYMPQNYNKSRIILDGETISAADEAYMKRFMPQGKKSATVEYRTLSLSNITAISINHEKYDVMIENWDVRDAA